MYIAELEKEMKLLVAEAQDYDVWSLVRAARTLEETAVKLTKLAEDQLVGKEWK